MQGSSLDKNLALVARLIIGAIFILSAALKLIYTDQFVFAVQAYDLLPTELARAFALVYPWIELICGVCLLLGLFVRIVAVIAGLQLLVFIALMAITLARGKSIDCGCFVGLIRETVGPATLIRDIIMLVLLVPIYALPEHRLSLYPSTRFVASASRRLAVALAGGLVLFAAVALSSTIYGCGSAPSKTVDVVVPTSVAGQPSPVTTIARATPSAERITRPAGGWRLGPDTAKVVVVVFSDYQ